jgi:hypothetical protein
MNHALRMHRGERSQRSAHGGLHVAPERNRGRHGHVLERVKQRQNRTQREPLRTGRRSLNHSRAQS